ncbi:N-6 DNA methylase [Mycobacterium asiaticum]|uniref:N-6 DNA methylase n=1 Tax=Mycobacterium asiaticum TaxID=1790 RepID=UPI000685F464|nr:N-6 DNA methylase [Mycobacterium asiaticum]ORA15862.1 restriction endonuclease subunit M [Mycobacterium asiaticum DSM 44297]
MPMSRPRRSTAGRDLKDTLWKAAAKLRGSVPAGQYKDVVLSLVFLRHSCADQWKPLAANAESADIGQQVNEAMQCAMTVNPALAGTLPQLYHTVDSRRLGELIALLDSAEFTGPRDVMGEVYQYFLGNFARAEGRRGGEFFTPPSIVRVIVEVLRPTHGRVYDPCCGSGGMFVQTEQFIADQRGDPMQVAIYGQESVEETWRMARMNLAVHGLDAGGLGLGDTFVCDRHAGVQMDYVMANPPFNIKDWARDERDPRWRFGIPPVGNANYAWIQHILAKLAPRGKAAVVMTNGSMSSNTAGEGDIRARIVDADLVSCMVALPAQLFRSTGIPVCLWFFEMDKKRPGEVLFIDARGLGHLVDRAERALSDAEAVSIGDTYHAWLTNTDAYQDIPGFVKSVPLAGIRTAGYVLTPGRYVDSARPDDCGEAHDRRIHRLTTELVAALDESARLDDVVRGRLEQLRWK